MKFLSSTLLYFCLIINLHWFSKLSCFSLNTSFKVCRKQVQIIVLCYASLQVCSTKFNLCANSLSIKNHQCSEDWFSLLHGMYHSSCLSQCDRLGYPIGHQMFLDERSVLMTSLYNYHQHAVLKLESCIMFMMFVFYVCEIIMVLSEGKYVKPAIVFTLLSYSIIPYWILSIALLRIKKWYSLSSCI